MNELHSHQNTNHWKKKEKLISILFNTNSFTNKLLSFVKKTNKNTQSISEP